jgi:hypothetical protein
MIKINIEKNKNLDEEKSIIWTYERKLPDFICNEIIKEFDLPENHSKGLVGADGKIVENFRNVNTQPVPRTHWLNGFFHYFSYDANYENFQYKIDTLSQVDFLKYTKGMFYKLHSDVSPKINCSSHKRKLTTIIQLSDESDYCGGDLVIFGNTLEQYKITKKKGSIIVFPSYLPHEVKEVKEGIRYSLVGWITGPPFS